jgi:short-subunit dehydrogenase
MQYAVVTGASKGIGLAIAEALAAHNYNLFLCSTKTNELETIAATIQNKNSSIKIYTLACDLSNEAGVLQFADFIKATTSQIQVLVNNAGRFVQGQIRSEPKDNLESMLHTNLYSAYYLTKALLPLMEPFNTGYIFNICSVASHKAYDNGGSYSISKFALLGFSKNLREELKPFGIKVTAISPGATWSNSWAGVALPEDRLMQAADIAKVVVNCLQLSPSAVVEDIVMRPQLGDL